MEAVSSWETSVTHHNTEESDLQQNRRENVRCLISKTHGWSCELSWCCR